MFKYKNVMVAAFILFFFATLIQLIYSCFDLPAEERPISLICGTVLFIVPLAVFLSGRLKRLMPYILMTFYVCSCFVMSVFNGSESFLPMLYACAVVICGFFLSSKLCLWLLALSDLSLIATVIFFLPGNEGAYFGTVYLVVCLCFNLSGFAMALFIQAVQNNLFYLRRKNKEITVSDRRKDLFWAASAKKMRTSAKELSEVCGTLLSRSDIPVPIREKLSDIQNGTSRLFMTLNAAEDYALTESGHMELKNEPYRFDGLVTDIANFCAAAELKENVDILIDCQPDIPFVLIGDSRRIAQIIMNLFENSVKFTESGSITVAFSARRTDEGVNLQIQVIDTGRGIGENAATKIFTVYAEDSVSNPVIHLGLGISKQLVSLMGGFIFVRKEKTGGSRFTLTIPQKTENPLPFAAVQEPEKLRILLYIKGAAVKNSALTQLEKMGVPCSLCNTKAEFMMKKDESDITHIFCDYSFYTYDKPIFDILARHINVIVICGVGETESPLPKNIKRMLKPINMAAFSHIFNKEPIDPEAFVQEFTAPEAKVLIAGDNTDKLKALEKYGIRPVYTIRKNVIRELRNQEFDIIFLCDNTEGSAARIMTADEGIYMHIPVIDFGGSGEGCSGSLSQDFDPLELEKILESYLPESKLQYNSQTDSEPLYKELNPGRGIFNAGGSRSAYKEMLEIFIDRAKDVSVNIDKYISSKEIEKCGLLLNSVKTAASSIGAVSAAENARQAISASERFEWALLKELCGQLLIKLDLLRSDIRLYFSEAGIEHLDKERLSQCVKRLRTAAYSGDKKLADIIFQELLSCSMTYSQRCTIKSSMKYFNGNCEERAVAALEKLTESGEKDE